MYQSILIAIDIAQIKKAPSMIQLAGSMLNDKGVIILLNVIEDVPQWIASTLPVDFLSERENDSIRELTALAQKAEIKANIKVQGGHASQTIIHTANEMNVELIIVASHKPEIKDYFLGSTASNVVRHAECSVLVQR